MQINWDWLPFVFDGECQARPTIRPPGICRAALGSDVEARKTQDNCLPRCPSTGGMNAVRRIATEIFQVDHVAYHEEIIGFPGFVEFAGQDYMECRRE